MMRPRLTFANVMSVIAVFIALGGASYAAFKLPKNSVGTKQIKPNAINSSKVADGSLKAGDFASGQLPEGPQGPKGDIGPSGLDGAAIAVRARSTASAETSAASTITVPLTSNTWTQAAGELDLGPFSQITFTEPGPQSCNETGTATLIVGVYIDGKLFTDQSFGAPRNGETRTVSGGGASASLFEPNMSVAHTVTAKVSSACESGPLPAPFTVSDLELDMIRAR
jgi:hypothetical protein